MTLFIAWLLMDHMGIQNPFVYGGAVVVWILHIMAHSSGK